MNKLTCRFLFLLVLFAVAARAGAAPTKVRLALNQKATQPIVIAPTASDRVKAAAATLADYLKRISGAPFEIKQGDGQSGITLGVATDFPQLPLSAEVKTNEPARREDYILRSHAGGVYLIGATDIAVEHAVWDMLYRLGYRQFFPGEHWEVVPSSPELSLAVDVQEHPDFQSRRIWFTYGIWPENGKRVQQWYARNRAGAGIALNTGHSYGNIISKNKAEFAAHPEYFPLIDGKRRPGTQAKFCISNPGLRQLVVNYALRTFEGNPEADSISVDPSDGGGWCECEQCAKMGSVSDRVTILANQVADAVNEKFAAKYGTKYVGFYAYNFHSPPPTVRVHPGVIVSVATAFVRGGYTVDQLIEGWKKQGATIGMREYYSIIHWDHDLPNVGRASRLDYMKTTIPHFHASDARFMSAESSDNWGPHGLGYYVAARILWDIDQANHIDEIVDDFLEKAFGPAKKPMTEFYGQLNGVHGAKPGPLSDDYIGRLYRSLEAAYKLTDDAAIRARLDDLAIYARYLELYLAYNAARGEARQAKYEEMIRHAYRTRSTHMLHSMAIYRTGLRDKSVKIPAEAKWNVPEKDKKGEPQNPWKQDPTYTLAEIQDIVHGGIERNKLLDFTPVEFSTDLVPASKLKLSTVAPGELSLLRGTQNIYVYMEKPGAITLQASAGHLYSNRGPAKLQLFSTEEGTVAANEEANNDKDEEAALPTAIDTKEVPPDAKEHAITFQVPRPGLYRIQLSDRMMGSHLSWPAGTTATLRSALGATTAIRQRWKLYFYVPKGTARVAGFAYGGGRILNAAGKTAYNYEAKDGYFNIPVEKGQDGRLWAFESAGGQIGLMTVPPYLARSGDELLLPKEVVQADALQ